MSWTDRILLRMARIVKCYALTGYYGELCVLSVFKGKMQCTDSKMLRTKGKMPCTGIWLPVKYHALVVKSYLLMVKFRVPTNVKVRSSDGKMPRTDS